MNATEPIRPLKDVWLRPRRVFREMSSRPIGIVDYLLAGAQGIGNWLVLNQAQPSSARLNGWDLISNAMLFGPIAGVVGVWFYTLIYSRLSTRMGRPVTRDQVFHVMAYGGVPVIAGIVLWAATLLLTGDAMFSDKAGEVDGFLWALIQAQKFLSALLFLWSYLLQVMGLSELSGQTVPKAFGMWILGQLLGAAAAIFLTLVVASLLQTAPA